jgi:hypothetical protein
VRSGATASERLRAKVAIVLPGLEWAGRSFLHHPDIRAVYPRFLAAFHGVVRASVPLMQAALDRSVAMSSTDPVAAGLVGYLRGHIPEEMQHDEWVIQDLGVLGIESARIVAAPSSPIVAQLVGAQYYWIFHYHPVALLGYMTLLEGYPPSQADVDDLIVRSRFPREAFRTLLHHADLDPGHASELSAAIDALPMSLNQEAVLGVSAISSAHLLTQLLLGVADGSDTAGGQGRGAQLAEDIG